MIVERGPELHTDPATVLTVGTFDGVHVGHQTILRYLRERAAQREGTATVLTFDPHPRTLLTGTQTPLLTTVDERAALLSEAGIERLVVLPFTHELAAMEAEDYVRDVLVRQIGLREMVVGYDHAFGRARRGTTDLLRAMSGTLGFSVDQMPAALVDDAVVSSTRIRNALIERGAVDEAEVLLGRPYALSGMVVEGVRRGRTIGFPTANLRPDSAKLIPLNGVYAVRVFYGRERFGGMLNIGIRPTFDGSERRAEVNLFDFEGDLYGETIRLEFVKHIRAERKFDSAAALSAQLSLDTCWRGVLVGAESPVCA
ncbi:MAG: bifunctional riboflavin kinase/FAD synthetase, partial [Bacteroidota bacterium]